MTQQGRPAFTVAVASPESALVQTTVADLAAYFESRLQIAPTASTVSEMGELSAGEHPVVLLGTAGDALVRGLIDSGRIPALPADLGAEGFQLALARGNGMSPCIAAVGTDDLGTRHAAIELLRRQEWNGTSMDLSLPEPVVRSPAFELRFWYVNEGDHVLNRYHSLHWDIRDWERYLDMVSFFRYNVLEIYPPSVTETGAVFSEGALSGEADQYLERTRHIIRYAHSKGLRVCITMTFNMSGGKPLCPSRDGLDKVVEVNGFFIEALGEADFFNLFPGDPGECRCAECTPDTAIDVQLRIIDFIRERTQATPILSTWNLPGWGDDLYDLTSTYELWGRRHREFPEDIMLQWIPHQASYAAGPIPQKRLAWAYATDPEPPVEVMPHFHLRSFQQYLQQRCRDGVEAISTNTWSPRLQLVNMFGAAELMWDPDRNVEDITGDLATGLFGPAHRDVGQAWVHLGDMYCKDAKYDKVGNHGVVLFILADGSRSRQRGTAEIFREEEDLGRGEEAVRLFDQIDEVLDPPPFIVYPSPGTYLEEYRYYARFYRDLARHARWVRDARRAARSLGARLQAIGADMPEEELTHDDMVELLNRAAASGQGGCEEAAIRQALAAIQELDLARRLEEYFDHTGLDREVHAEAQRRALPTFLVMRELYDDPVALAPHFRKLSAAQLEQYRQEREARRPRFVE